MNQSPKEEAMATDEPFAASDEREKRELQTHLTEQRKEFTDLLEDVRARVIQVKRETDQKAPADHTHAELAESVAAVTAGLEELEAELSALEETVTDGFENFEEVLAYLVDEIDEIDSRTVTLANAVVDSRNREQGREGGSRRRAAADRLKLAANRAGISQAACEACASSVEIGLLTVPDCPHCGREFTDVKSKRLFFGSNTLLTEESTPELEGPSDVEDRSK